MNPLEILFISIVMGNTFATQWRIHWNTEYNPPPSLIGNGVDVKLENVKHNFISNKYRFKAIEDMLKVEPTNKTLLAERVKVIKEMARLDAEIANLKIQLDLEITEWKQRLENRIEEEQRFEDLVIAEIEKTKQGTYEFL